MKKSYIIIDGLLMIHNKNVQVIKKILPNYKLDRYGL